MHEKGSQSLYTGQQPRTKRAFRPADKPVINAGQQLGWFPRRFTSEFLCFCLHKDVQRHTKHAEAMLYESASIPHPGMKSASCPAGKRSLQGQDRRS